MDQGGDRAILVANTRNTGTTYVDVDTQPGVQHIHGVSSRLTARLTSHWSGTGTSGPPIPWRSTPRRPEPNQGSQNAQNTWTAPPDFSQTPDLRGKLPFKTPAILNAKNHLPASGIK